MQFLELTREKCHFFRQEVAAIDLIKARQQAFFQFLISCISGLKPGVSIHTVDTVDGCKIFTERMVETVETLIIGCDTHHFQLVQDFATIHGICGGFSHFQHGVVSFRSPKHQSELWRSLRLPCHALLRAGLGRDGSGQGQCAFVVRSFKFHRELLNIACFLAHNVL